MTNTQVTHIQIDNYGPWTVTPEPRREVDLQTLQSRLFADLSQLFGNRDAYVFFTRFDNMIAVSNGVDLDDHALIQESVANRYPVTMSLSVATGTTPAEALGTATEQLQAAGSAQDEHRREILKGRVVDEEFRTDEDVQIAHFDVNDATEKYTDQLNEFDTFIQIEQGYAELMRHMRRAHDSLAFFVGGDNVIVSGAGRSRLPGGDRSRPGDRRRRTEGRCRPGWRRRRRRNHCQARPRRVPGDRRRRHDRVLTVQSLLFERGGYKRSAGSF